MPGGYGFSASGGGSVELRVEPVERELLLSLAQQIVSFVSPDPPDPNADPLEQFVGITPGAEQPDDPALARLLPDAFKDDDQAAVEFRRYTERGLRESKVANAATVVRALETGTDVIAIPASEVGAWLGMLNDTRLVLGERISVTEDNHAQLAGLPADDPRHAQYQVYDWLTFLQDTLVQLRLEEFDG